MTTVFDTTDRAPLPDLPLRTSHGQDTSLHAHIGDRPVLVQLVRYYGCLPCQHYLLDLHGRLDELDRRDIDLVVIGVAADFQARHLVDTYDLTVPLLLDPDQVLYRALTLRRMRPLDLLRPRMWRAYLPLFIRRYLTRQVTGPTQGRIVGDPLQLPGLALLDTSGRPLLVQRGTHLGDYPPIDDLLAAIDAMLETGPPSAPRGADQP